MVCPLRPVQQPLLPVPPEAYAFIARLDAQRTIDETWQKCLGRKSPRRARPGRSDPDARPTLPSQPTPIRCFPGCRQVVRAIQAPKAKGVALQADEHPVRPHPLFDPNHLLNKTWPVAKMVFSKVGFFVWLAILAFGLYTAFSNFGELVDQSEGVLNPANLPWLYVVFLSVKVLHEGGHAYITKKYGGEVHTLGIMLMVFNPIPYVDATAAWSFRERWKRVLVGSGGMMVELLLASIAAVIWVNTGDGLLHSIAYNVMFVASVSTLILNINPLMRFDGYYILSDLTDTPNLHQRAARQFFYVCEKYIRKPRRQTHCRNSERKFLALHICRRRLGLPGFNFQRHPLVCRRPLFRPRLHRGHDRLGHLYHRPDHQTHQIPAG